MKSNPKPEIRERRGRWREGKGFTDRGNRSANSLASFPVVDVLCMSWRRAWGKGQEMWAGTKSSRGLSTIRNLVGELHGQKQVWKGPSSPCGWRAGHEMKMTRAGSEEVEKVIRSRSWEAWNAWLQNSALRLEAMQVNSKKESGTPGSSRDCWNWRAETPPPGQSVFCTPYPRNPPPNPRPMNTPGGKLSI